MEDEINSIDQKVQELQKKKRNIKEQREKRLRLRSNNSGKPNTLSRISSNFSLKLDKINVKRVDNGFEELSSPKITELIIRHKKHWPPIERDLINYNTLLDKEDKEENFNEK